MSRSRKKVAINTVKRDVRKEENREFRRSGKLKIRSEDFDALGDKQLKRDEDRPPVVVEHHDSKPAWTRPEIKPERDDREEVRRPNREPYENGN